MSTTIISKHSTVQDSTPQNLETGELAINTVLGKLFYGDDNGNPQQLQQRVYVQTSFIQPSSPGHGAFWWVTNLSELRIYVNNVWMTVGLPEDEGGDISVTGNLTVNGTATFNPPSGVVLVLDDTGATFNDVVRMSDTLTVNGRITAQGGVTAVGNCIFVNVTQNGTMTVGNTGHITKQGRGRYLHNASITTGGGVFTGTSLPSPSGYENGDWFYVVVP